jgi:hypothetical protein
MITKQLISIDGKYVATNDMDVHGMTTATLSEVGKGIICQDSNFDNFDWFIASRCLENDIEPELFGLTPEVFER